MFSVALLAIPSSGQIAIFGAWQCVTHLYILLTLTQFLVVLAFHMAMVYVECLVGPAKQLFVLTF